MKNLATLMIFMLGTLQAFTQNNPVTTTTSNTGDPTTIEPFSQILLPILFIAFLVFMLITLIKYFLEFRLKNKLVDRGMAEQLSNYLGDKNVQEKQNDVIKLAVLFCGLGAGLTLIYLTGPIGIHSLAIMAFSIGLSYLAYFFYLRK